MHYRLHLSASRAFGRAGLCALALLSGVGAAYSQSLSQRYIISDLGTLNGRFGNYAKRINIQGHLVGVSSNGTDNDGFYYNGMGLFDLGNLPGQQEAEAYWINDSNIITGSSGLAANRRAYRWQNGVMTSLGLPQAPFAEPDIAPFFGYNYSEGVTINNGGQVALNLGNGPFKNGVFSSPWGWMQIQPLPSVPPVLGGPNWSAAVAMNNAGRILGRAGNGDFSDIRAFLWTPPTQPNQQGQIQELSVKTQDETNVFPTGITDSLAMCGYSGFYQTIPFDNQPYFMSRAWGIHPVDGVRPVVPLPNTTLTEAKGIRTSSNGNPENPARFPIVGRSGTFHIVNNQPRYEWKATIWYYVPGVNPIWTPFDVNTLLPPGTNVQVADLFATNEAGQIAGIIAAPNGEYRVALLTPVVVPIKLTLADPGTVVGGRNIICQMSLDRDPGGSIDVNLRSSNTNVATVPATVAANALNTPFQIRTRPVAASTPVTITAERFGHSATVVLRVNPAALNAVTATPNPITGGLTSVGTVEMTGPVASDTVVSLNSSNPQVASVPNTITVRRNNDNVEFPIQTTVVHQNTSVTLRATVGQLSKVTTLNVVTPFVSNLLIDRSSVFGGDSIGATVSLSNRALANSVIELQSSSPTVASIDNWRVTVPKDQISGRFLIRTTRVRFNTNVLITASFNQSSRSAALTVRTAALDSFTFHPTSLRSTNPDTVLGGDSCIAVIRTDGPVPSGGIQIQVTSSNPGAATAPNPVSIPTGGTSVAFRVNTSIIASTTNVTFTATYQTVTRTAVLRVEAADLLNNQISPTPVRGGARSVGTITLSRPAQQGGALVFLSSPDPDAFVPNSITIAQGATQGRYMINTAPVTASKDIVITATRGAISRAETITLLP
ncbi:MAG TPA: hypothetical protein VEX38_04310 [Fimbriimonadaceae bacterium]|nr:hypothetical protein [Fimbriimonadaceae bacterium]